LEILFWDISKIDNPDFYIKKLRWCS